MFVNIMYWHFYINFYINSENNLKILLYMEAIISYEEKYPNLEAALKDNAVLHASRSGGGLRIVRLEKDGKLLTYGEFPWFSGALSHAENDFGLSYNEQYLGKDAKHLHYLTGASPDVQDIIDRFILCGDSVDIRYSNEENQFICNAPRYSGVGKDILSSIYSCINAKMMYHELGKFWIIGQISSAKYRIFYSVFFIKYAL